MITIPTSELVTVLSGALAFAPVVKTDLMRGILIEWDGEALHASGYDVLSGARVSWWDGAGREGLGDEDDDTERPQYGGDDDPWRAFVAYDDVTDLLKTFKLAAKLWWVPVNLKVNMAVTRLIVERSPEWGKPEAVMVVRSDHDVTAKFPDVHQIVERVLSDAPGLHDRIQFAPQRLAAYGAVQVGDVMTLTFGRDGDPTVVGMGSRVTGFAYPVGAQRSEVRTKQEFNLLRDGSGVIVGGQTGSGKTDPEDLFDGDRRYVDSDGKADPEA